MLRIPLQPVAIETLLNRERRLLSANSYAVLRCVLLSPDPVSTREIVQSTGLDRKLVGVIVHRLCAAALIERHSRGVFTSPSRFPFSR